MSIVRPKSIVDQINEILRQRIYDELYPPGSRLPSESELLEEFNVSRATIRTALTRLAAEGLILRKQGDGTYVNEHLQGANAQFGSLWDYVRLIRRTGHEPSIQLLELETRSAGPEESKALALEPADPVLSLTRLLLADERPVILTTNALPRHLVHAADSEIDGALPMRDLLQTYCQRRISYALFDIRATLAGGDVARVLGHRRGESLLRITTTFYSADNDPIVYGTSYYDDAFLNLRLIQSWS